MNELLLKTDDLYYEDVCIENSDFYTLPDPELSMIYIKQDILNLFDNDIDKLKYLQELKQFINTLSI